MTNEAGPGPGQQDPVVDRDQLLRVLRRAGLLSDQVRAAVEALDLPAPVSVVADHMLQVGITRSVMIDAMGGSP